MSVTTKTPLGTSPCVEEKLYDGQCFRDRIRNDKFKQLAVQTAKCPECGAVLAVKEGPPWRCENCVKQGKKKSLEEFFFPDRAMNWCTAIHAEVWAILAAGDRARGGILYTTTFPCFQCAEKISQTKIKKVIFTEAYPDALGAERFSLAGIELAQYEGVRSTSFERIFSPTKPD